MKNNITTKLSFLSTNQFCWIKRGLFFLFTLLYLTIFYRDELYQLFWNNYFLSTTYFAKETLHQSGGLLIYIGRFLNQLFYYPIISIGLVSLLLSVLPLWLSKLFDRENHFSIITYLPSLLFLFELTQAKYSLFNNFEISYFFAPFLGVCLSLFLYSVWMQISKFLRFEINLFVFSIFAILVYPFCGIYSLVALLLILCKEFTQGKSIFYIVLPLVLFFVLPLIQNKCLFDERYLHTLISPIPDYYYLDTALCNVLIILCLILLALLPKWKRTIAEVYSVGGLLILWVLLSIVPFTKNNSIYRSEMKMIRLADEQDWNGILKIMPSKVTHIQNAYRVIALAHTNQLNSNLFDIELPFETNNKYRTIDLMVYYSDLYYYASMPSVALAFTMEKWTSLGETYKALEFFIKIAILQDKKQLAGRYINLMKHSFALKAKAEKYEQYLTDENLFYKDHPFFKQLKKFEFDDDISFHLRTAFVNQFLSYKNISAANIERRLMADLYKKDLKILMNDLNVARHVYSNFPSYVQEAVIIYAMEVNNPAVMQIIPINRVFVDRIQNFKKELSKFDPKQFEEAAHQLYAEYSNSYFYYYLFNLENYSSNIVDYVKK